MKGNLAHTHTPAPCSSLQEPELEDGEQGDPRDQEAPAELDDGEEGEDDPCEREKSSSEVRVGREGGRKVGVAGGAGGGSEEDCVWSFVAACCKL